LFRCVCFILACLRGSGYTFPMKQLLLCGINARYSHSCLALLCLKHAAEEGLPIETAEFSINDRVPAIAEAILRAQPDAVGFSCYIWNIEIVLKVASTIKKVLPECFLLLGGPEVSYDAPELMETYPFIDMIVCGSGETPFARFAPRFCRGEDVSDTPSACVRAQGGLRQNPAAPPVDMNAVRFMYGDLSMFRNHTIYYETSRGCPFCCAYCLSAGEPVSFLDLERVEKELENFIASGVRQVKLVDRTFNYPPERAKRILRALISLKHKYPQSPTNFHLEVSACLLDEEMMTLLGSAPEGLLQLEVGVQSTHAETLLTVHRAHDTGAVLKSTAALCALPNLRVHADLIAGLPEEGYAAFSRSFDDVYSLKPAALQLGFLKLLRGSALRREAERRGIVYTDYPPYEVLSTPAISYAELSALHRIAELTDVLYNSGGFESTLAHFISEYFSAFVFFERAAALFDERGYYDRPQRPQRAYELLAELSAALPESTVLREALSFDWCCRSEGGAWPRGVEEPTAPEPLSVHRFFECAENIQKYLPHCDALPSKRIEKRCRIYSFPHLFAPPSLVLFDYGLCREDKGFMRVISGM
jgi:radical SAM superfamily enzyme YgiQ (UPF0313 family)